MDFCFASSFHILLSPLKLIPENDCTVVHCGHLCAPVTVDIIWDYAILTQLNHKIRYIKKCDLLPFIILWKGIKKAIIFIFPVTNTYLSTLKCLLMQMNKHSTTKCYL